MSSEWVGPEYETGFNGRRLLIVAEPLPQEAAVARVGRGFEADLVAGYLDASVKHRQFTDVARMVLGRAADRDECVAFYDYVALVNFPEPSSRRQSTAEVDWSRLGVSLDEWASTLRPEALLVLGERLGVEASAWCAKNGYRGLLVRAMHPGTPGFAFRDQLPKTAALRARQQQS